MLRRVRSASLLGVRSPASTLTPAVLPASPIQKAQSRSLASAVLLNSQRNWQKETVAGLKSELKRRGLSQQGNKATLLARLASAETSSFLPPVPSIPSNVNIRSSSSSPSNTRSLSTTASLLSPPKKALSKEDTGHDIPATSTESVTTTGPDISSKSTEAPKKDKITPQQVTSAPGLPVGEVTSSPVTDKMEVALPKPRTEEDVEQIIPSTPDNFLSNSTENKESKSTPSDEVLPKVMTVASAATHPAGGPVHGNHEPSDAHSHEVSVGEAASEALKAAKGSIPSLTDAVTGVLGAPIRAWKATGLELPAVGIPKIESDGRDFKPIGRGLNDQEGRGAYILAGVAALALFLGGPSKEKKGNSHGKEGKGGKGGKKGAVGDNEWEKASGAGIVGHGARKD